MLDLVGTRTLRDLLDEQVARDPDKIFLVVEDASGQVAELSYRAFVDGVDAVATGLSKIGVLPGDKVTVHLRNCVEVPTIWFALASLGAVFVPSNVANTAAEMRHVLSFSDSVAVITEPALATAVRKAAPECADVRHIVIARASQVEPGEVLLDELLSFDPPPPRPPVTSDDVVEIIFTSGTTAQPKGVMLTHANALHAGERTVRMLRLDRGERCLTALPLFHVNAQTLTLLAALTAGGTCILLEEYRASKFWAQVRRHGATYATVVAMQARTLLAQPPDSSDVHHQLRRVFYAINIPTPEKDEFERRFGVELINGYGLSEAMTVVTCSPVYGPRRWPSIGRPVHDRRVRLVDESGCDVATGDVGELLVQGIPGRTLMKGYYKDPESTARTIIDGWLRTGDNAYADEAGYIFFFDRAKDVIKRAGENISASEVEAVLLQHPGVAEAAVIGVPDPIRDESVMAIVVAADGVELTTESIQAFCRERLAIFKVPTIVTLRDSLPKTAVGKIEKKLLRTP